MRRAVRTEVRQSTLNMRTTEKLRNHLEAQAAKSGRTLSHEVEYRLERSFAEDAVYTTPTNAAILRDLAGVFQIVGFDRNSPGNEACKAVLLKVFERIVSAHLMAPEAEAGLGGLLRASKSKSDPFAADPERYKRMEETILRLTDAVIATSALAETSTAPDSAPVVSSKAPFGFGASQSSSTLMDVLGAIGALPRSPADLSKDED